MSTAGLKHGNLIKLGEAYYLVMRRTNQRGNEVGGYVTALNEAGKLVKLSGESLEGYTLIDESVAMPIIKEKFYG